MHARVLRSFSAASGAVFMGAYAGTVHRRCYAVAPNRAKNAVAQPEHEPVVDLLSMMPDSLMDESIKSSFREIARFADTIMEQRATETKLQHPLLVSVALLRLYSIEFAERLRQNSKIEKLADVDEYFMAQAMHFLQISDEVYGSTPPFMRPDVIMNRLHEPAAGSHVKTPRHAVLLDHLTKSIVVAVRGTASVSDIVTDLYIHNTPFLRGMSKKKLYSHGGMADSAEGMLDGVVHAINQAKTLNDGRYKDYSVVFTGHSLGAGTAILLAIMISVKAGIPSKTFAFAPPTVISQQRTDKGELARITKDAPVEIHSFVNDQDIIPRCSFREFMHLLTAIEFVDALPWSAIKRSTAVIRAELLPEEFEEMRQALVAVQERGQIDERFQEKRDDVELYIPGNIYWLRPVAKDGTAVFTDTDTDSHNTDKDSKIGERSNSSRGIVKDRGTKLSAKPDADVRGSERSKAAEELARKFEEAMEAWKTGQWQHVSSPFNKEKSLFSFLSDLAQRRAAASDEPSIDAKKAARAVVYRHRTRSNRQQEEEEQQEQGEEQQAVGDFECVRVSDSRQLMSGVLFTGTNMLQDHRAEAYIDSFVKLRR